MLPRLRVADRKSLLLGTALASTLLLGSLLAPAPAHAAVNCPPGTFPPPGPIAIINPNDDIVCVNVYDRFNNAGTVIDLSTNGGNEYISLNNSGMLNANAAVGTLGVEATTLGGGSPIEIVNVGDFNLTSTGSFAFGILAQTAIGANSPVSIVNSGDFDISAATVAYGIGASTSGDSPISIVNSGGFDISSSANFAVGIHARSVGDNSSISIVNSGDLSVLSTANLAYGIYARTFGDNSSISIDNRGDLVVTSTGSLATGIYAATFEDNSRINVENHGDASATGDTAFGIFAQTTGGDGPLDIVNGGALTAFANVGNAFGIYALTSGGAGNSPLNIENSGDINAAANQSAFGIRATTVFTNSPLSIENSGDITASSFGAGNVFAILATTTGTTNSPIAIMNSGKLTATTDSDDAWGIFARSNGTASDLLIENSGDIVAMTTAALFDAYGIGAGTNASGSSIAIENSGDFTVSAGENAFGIFAETDNIDSPTSIVNSGDITANAASRAFGIRAQSNAADGPIDIENSGDIASISTGYDALGIFARAYNLGNNSSISIENSGDVTVISEGGARGLYARTTYGAGASITMVNHGDITAMAGIQAGGIFGETRADDSPLSIVNSGDITTSASGAAFEPLNGGIFADTFGLNSPLSVVNSGNITSTAEVNNLFGIFVNTRDDGSPLSIVNSAAITVSNVAGDAFGIRAYTIGMGSPLNIENSGTVMASGGAASVGIDAFSNTGTTIVNSGFVSSQSLLAIQVGGAGNAQIFNSGTIFGYVLLDADDTMVNQAGGTFEARLTSDFDATGSGGNDLFRNEEGGTVHAVEVNGAQPSFVNLERFENSGLISMVDGDVGDVFTISNTVGGTDLDFVAGSGALAVDAFLGPPGSTADNFIIDGDVFGKTQVTLNNTRPGGGAFNPVGIPVVFVPNGQVQSNAFFMPQPFDSGLFDWDVYFVPTGGGSGFFELRSFPGGGSHVLPQLLTAAQDVWHTTNETWFDRTADLRVLLNGGAAYGAGGGKLEATPSTAFTPGVWLKGSGTWLEQEDSASTSAYGRTYRYNLNRDLDVWNLEGGVDFGKKGVLAEGDALVFGLLGGAILGTLDYDQLIRQFDIEGGEVGGYATYLSGGLFVDTLVKVDFLEFDTQGAPGLPSTLDSTAWGFRTDAGYRFGGFRRGPFVEPLATIAVAWSEIDDFTFGGNTVKFDDEANVRGRLGLRVGTSREVWTGIVAEPFVIGSVWGNLSGDNKATVTSFGTSFQFTDEPDDVWGVVSTGVNFFSPGASTSLFAKLDVTFGEETEGISARGGMRYNW